MLTRCFPLFLLFAVAVSGLLKLPTHWPTCKRGPDMNTCLRQAIEIAIRDLEKGNKTLGVGPLDPWNIKQFFYNRKNPIPVTLNARDIVVTGYRQIKVESVKTDWKLMEIAITTPILDVVSQYAINGSFLNLPIDGKGRASIHLAQFKGKVKLVFDKIVKKGRDFLKVKDAELYVDSGDAKFKLENLFNGNKALGDRMNDVINANWDILLELVRPVLAKGLAEPMKKLAAGIFTKVPMDFIIPK